MIKIVFALLAGLTLLVIESHAAVYNPGAIGFATEKEKCATALNSYLLYRHGTQQSDNLKLQKMENQIEAMCEGYQIRLVSKDGGLSGIIEAAK